MSTTEFSFVDPEIKKKRGKRYRGNGSLEQPFANMAEALGSGKIAYLRAGMYRSGPWYRRMLRWLTA